MFVPTSLNKYVPWRHVLNLLELPCPSRVLPAHTRCPYCLTGRLKILQDRLSGGQWHSCEDCNRSGDMLQLAQHCLQLDIPATVDRLHASGLPRLPRKRELIENYQHTIRDHFERPQQLWAESQKRFTQCTADVPRILRLLRLASGGPNSRWAGGMGQMVGAVPFERVEALLPGHYKRPTTQVRRAGAYRDVIVVPFQDVPGRYCSFLLLGRQGRMDRDILLKFSPALCQPQPEHQGESGLLFHPRIFAEAARWGNAVLTMPYPFLVLNLQARQFERSFRSLPLVGWYPHGQRRPRNSWDMFREFQRVLWAPGAVLDPIVMAQAITYDMDVARRGPSTTNATTLAEYLSRTACEQVTEQLLNDARPWPEVVAEYLHDADEVTIENFFRGLHLEGIEHTRVLGHLSHRLANRCRDALRQNVLAASVLVDCQTIVEQGGRWHLADKLGRPRTEIMDGILRLDSVTRLKRSRRTFYRGRLLYRGEELPFTVPMQTFDKNPFAFLKDLLLTERSALLAVVPSWNRRLIAIAQKFQPVTPAPGVDQVGWDGTARQFVLPNFRVDLGGRVTPTPEQFCDEHCPAQNLLPPALLTPADLDQLHGLTDAVRQVAVGLLVIVLSNILARATGRVPVAAVLSGQVPLMKELAALYGCRSRTIRQDREVGAVTAVEELHDWPVLVESWDRHKAWFQDWLYGVGDAPLHNCLLPGNWLPAAAAHVTAGWPMLANPETERVMSPKAAAMLVNFIPHYLQDVCERRLQLNGDETWLELVHADIVDFVQRRGGQTGLWTDVWDVLRPDTDKARLDSFADLTGQLVRNGNYAVRPKDFCAEGISAFITDEDKLIIDRVGLRDFLRKTQGIRFDTDDTVTRLLQQGRVLREADDQHWVVALDWWQKRFRQTERVARRWRVIS